MFQNLSVNERAFMLEAMRADCRTDARTRTESRLLRDYEQGVHNSQIRFGEENGQALVQIGQTKAITSSSLKIISPKPAHPNEGEIKFVCEFTSLVHQAEYGQQTRTLGEMKFEISNFIEKVIKSSRATDNEGLCIIQGKLAWALQVDIQLLNDDGNIMDVFFLAAICALKNTKLPEVTMKKDQVFVSRDPAKHRPINVHHIPVCTTFYYINGIEEPLVDATAKEEKLASARLSICMNVFEDVCGMQTLGLMHVAPEQILQCADLALECAKQTTAIVREAWENKSSIVEAITTAMDVDEER